MEKILKRETEYGTMTVEILDITPEIAEAMIERNVQNRNPRKNKIRGYAREMKRELWKENGIPIIFDDEGVLKDGQHRLKAIIESKVTAKNVVVITVPKSQASCYDIGATRSIGDISVLEGRSERIFLDNNLLSAASVMYQRCYKLTNSEISKTDILKHIEHYEDAFRWWYKIAGTVRTKGLRRAPVAATIISAFIIYSGDSFAQKYTRDQIEHFTEVLMSGMATNKKDVTIITLRNFLFTVQGATGNGLAQEIYYKAQRALNAFLHGEELTKLYNTKKEYYVMPEIQDD